MVNATDAKNSLGAILKAIKQDQDEAVEITSHGAPVAVVVSAAAFEELRGLKQEKRRQEAVAVLNRIAAEQAERNKDLTPEDVERLTQMAIEDIRQYRRERAAERLAPR